MKCVQCGNEGLRPTKVRRSVTVAGRTIKRQVPALRCDACRETFVADADLENFELSVASELAGGAPSGQALRFMRKALSMRAVDLASLMGATPETVSRWENEKQPTPRLVFALLGTIVVERATPGCASTTLQRLRNMPPSERAA